MAYIGESHRHDWGTNVGGGGWTNFDDWYYRTDGVSHTLTAGDDILIGAAYDGVYYDDFAADTTALARWVVVVEGGSGTLQLDGGSDPDFDYDDISQAAQDLGSYTITGATEIVTDELTSPTHAELADFDAGAVVRIRCTSGSVTISQVKMRTWGVDSPLGAWTTGADFTRTNLIGEIRQSGTPDDTHFFTEVGPFAAEVDAWTALRTAIDSEEGQLRTFTHIFTGGGVAGSNFGTFFSVPTLDGYHGQAQFTVIEVSAPPVATYWYDVVGTHPTAGVDPREVPFEPISGARVAPGEPVYGQWISWNDDVRITATGAGMRISWKTLPDVPDYTVPGSNVKPLDVPADGTWFVDSGTGMDAPDSAAFLFTTVDDTYLSFIGGQAGSQATVPTPSRYSALTSGYQWFDPSLPWVEPEPEFEPRFWVKSGGIMRAVGPGKPADSPFLFHIPTPVGMFRDMTEAEYASLDPEEVPGWVP